VLSQFYDNTDDNSKVGNEEKLRGEERWKSFYGWIDEVYGFAFASFLNGKYCKHAAHLLTRVEI